MDLYAGSYILSHLCKTAINAAKSVDGVSTEIIFPVVSASMAEASLPNRFIAMIDANANDLARYGEQVKIAFDNELDHIAAGTIGNMSPAGCREQTSCLFSVNWLFYPFKNNDYKKSYAETERMLGAIKATRSFEQLPETGRKCAVCGERNVKFYRKTDSEDAKSKPPNKLFSSDVYVVGCRDYKEIDQRRLQPGEGVCSVCFIKRRAGDYFGEENFNEKFPSVSRIALMDAIQQLPQDQKDRLKGVEAQLIFDLNNRQKHEKLTERHSEEDINDAKTVLACLKDSNIPFTQYYAILAFDGDSMGAWLSGKRLKGDLDGDLFEFHQALSRKLSDYAKWTRQYFRSHDYIGRDIYAGGDDFLGFLNLRSLFDVLTSLKSEFDKIDLNKFSDRKLTISAGVAIAHYKTPLSIVLRRARAMEKKAKSVDDEKDALAIAVMKRSGELHESVFKWRPKGLPEEPLTSQILADVAKAMGEKAMGENEFSNTFIRAMDNEFRPLMDKNKEMNIPSIVKTEIKRLLKNSWQSTGPAANESYEDYQARKRRRIDWLESCLFEIYNNSAKFDNFLSSLHIVDFISRKAYGDD